MKVTAAGPIGDLGVSLRCRFQLRLLILLLRVLMVFLVWRPGAEGGAEAGRARRQAEAEGAQGRLRSPRCSSFSPASSSPIPSSYLALLRCDHRAGENFLPLIHAGDENSLRARGSGIDNMGVDVKDQKMTVVGSMDPVDVVAKLRKVFPGVDIVSVGPAKEDKKDDKKDGDKKDGGGDKKDGDKDKKDESKQVVYPPHYWYPPPPPQHHHPHPYYFVRSAEEDPNSCVIC
ncbi:hypothetical protein TRIUR3_07647 [Triticum urartu]|uniref:HMA domain-containing protein n=1 Tax=Triticum urartu TaxID=4572 RepID=M8APC8_TRIUA|nr:hypothetical protein TRIUR3_07647 [Triticum urartu]